MASSPRADAAGGRPVIPSHGALRPLGLAEARITGGFWAGRQRINGAATLDHGRFWMDKVGWTGNFASAAGAGPADRRGREFSDSEVYKLIEAMCWETGRRPDEARRGEIDELVALIGGIQAPDGYLSTAFGRPGQPPRYTDLGWGHELYCAGHLLQAAVAHTRVHGPGELLRIACRVADHVCAVFGPDGTWAVCGHPGIETAMVEFYRLTGERRYLDQAALFVDRRGHQSLPRHHFGWSYFSDDVPVREAATLRGHAVRALYLSCGAVDVAVETGDDELLRAVAAQFERTLARRTYLTGGMGSRYADEAFGDDFVLPADRAYAETCAGVAAVMLAWRLLLATGEDRYADVIERVLYNVIAAAIGDDGRSFFYANTLHQRTPTRPLPHDEEQLGIGGGPRAPWYEVSCCLPNIARLLAGLGAYLAAADADGLHVLQYADARLDTRLADGRRVALDMSTGYPDGGTVAIRIDATDGGSWPLTLRLPSWATGATVEAGGRTWQASGGRVTVRRDFAPGDEVRLHLPMTPRFTVADPRVDAVRGCVAVERGPVVYCAESTADSWIDDLDGLSVDPAEAPGEDDGEVVVTGRVATFAERPWPHAATATPAPAVPVRLLPYHRWARRGPATMRVWLPTGSEIR